MVSNLKELEKLLKLCRKQGVTKITLADVSFELGDMPQGQVNETASQSEANPNDPYANFPTGELTQSQLMFYSAGGDPSEDPENMP